VAFDRSLRSFWFRAGKIILINDTQIGQVRLHRLRSHKREERIDAVLCEVVRESSKEESSQCAAKSEGFGISLAVGETPCGQVERCKVVSEESVSASERNSVAEDGTTDCVT